MSESNEKPRKFRPLPKSNVTSLWERQLLRGGEEGKGKTKKCITNVVLILSNAPEWQGAIAWDEFAERVMVLKSCPAGKPGPWDDLCDKLTTVWLQQSEWRLEVGHELVAHAIEVVAKRAAFHPLRQRLESLEWDGCERLDTWTSKYLGAENSLVHQTIGVKWMLGAIARAYEPGCQMDSAIILEGPQGRGKSSALSILSLGFFTDELADVGSKDAAMQLHGHWIVEIAELDAISRADAAKVKAFLTRRVDRFRPPYGRHVVERPRQCVFAGSVNHNDYLKDETGGRRFWPIACGAIDLPALARDVEQLWAEALGRYRSGESTYVDDIAVAAQIVESVSERYQGDAWEVTILAYSQVRESVSVAECLEHVGVERSRWTQADQNRVTKILKSRGFARKQVRIGTQRVWRYYQGVVPSGDITGDTQSVYKTDSVTTVTTVTSKSETSGLGQKEEERDLCKVGGDLVTPVTESLGDWLTDQGIGTKVGGDDGSGQ